MQICLYLYLVFILSSMSSLLFGGNSSWVLICHNDVYSFSVSFHGSSQLTSIPGISILQFLNYQCSDHTQVLVRKTAEIQYAMTITGRKIKFPSCPVDMKSDISLTVLHQSHRGYDQMLYTSIWFYPLQELSVKWLANFMSTRQVGNSIFSLCVVTHLLLLYEDGLAKI